MRDPADPYLDFYPTGLPFNDLLGMRFEGLSGDSFVVRLSYREDLIGNPETGALFGGVLFALLDYALGGACGRLVIPERAVATIDLRVDYARVNEPGRDILAEGTCYRMTRQIAFARGTAYHAADEEPLATAQGTYMVYDTPAQWRTRRT